MVVPARQLYSHSASDGRRASSPGSLEFIFCINSSIVSVPAYFDPVRVTGCSCDVLLAFDGCEKEFYDYLLGAKVECVAVLRGHDELGRAVSVRVPF